MTPKEKEDSMNEFMQIGADIGKLPNQYQQLLAHMKLYSEFFERLWDAGYKQGQKDKLTQKEIRISKSN